MFYLLIDLFALLKRNPDSNSVTKVILLIEYLSFVSFSFFNNIIDLTPKMFLFICKTKHDKKVLLNSKVKNEYGAEFLKLLKNSFRQKN